MIKFFKEHYLFLVLFLLIILKEPIYKYLFNSDILTKTNECEILENDYNKLLEFNNIDLQYKLDFINTYIIFKDLYNYMNEITIKGGKNLNLGNDPVIYDNTLVGVIHKVNKNSSIVKLLTNNQSKISVKINDEVGILEYKNDALVVSDINNYSDIHIGDSVYTSGLGNIRENIFIGIVKEINLDNKSIEKVLKIDYKINIKNIDFVTILKEKK